MKLYGVESGILLPGTLWEFAAKPKMASKYLRRLGSLTSPSFCTSFLERVYITAS
jgi:hypothetical protein